VKRAVRRGSRTISSPLRQGQTARTRELLLETAAGFLATHDLDELSLPGLARLARMSPPTAYAHFPTMDDLLRGLYDWLQPQLRTREPPPPPDDLDELPRIRYPLYAQHGRLLRAVWNSASWTRQRHPTRWPYIRRLVENLRPIAPGLSDRMLNVGAAAITVFGYPPMWMWLRDAWGLDDEDATLAAEWATRTLVEALRTAPPGSAPRRKKRT
jgi:AcrR family transcriptional regulator